MSMVIDLHAHVVLEESFGAAGAYGPELSSDVKVQTLELEIMLCVSRTGEVSS